MAESSRKWTGGCLCGAVRYEIGGDGTQLCFCHCTSCRRATGAPMVPWGTFARATFVVTRGVLTEYRSSPEVFRGFCATCGTSLTYRHAKRDAEIDVTLGTLDSPEVFPPEAHIWVEDKVAWIVPGDGLPAFAKVRAERSEGCMASRAAVRPGYSTVSVRLVAADAAALIAFIRRVFDATDDGSVDGPAELRIGNSTILVTEAGVRAGQSAFLYLYVADVDGAYARAVEAGARSLETPRETPYGDRRAMVEDVWGNVYQIASYEPSVGG